MYCEYLVKCEYISQYKRLLFISQGAGVDPSVSTIQTISETGEALVFIGEKSYGISSSQGIFNTFSLSLPANT